MSVYLLAFDPLFSIRFSRIRIVISRTPSALANRRQLVTELFQHTRTPAHTHKLIFHEHAPSGHAKLSTCIKSHICVRINLLTLFVIIRCILLLYI